MAMNKQTKPESPVVWQASDAAEACRLKQQLGEDGVFVAGGTLLRTWWEAGTARMPGHLIDISGMANMQKPIVLVSSSHDRQICQIGAAALLSEVRNDSYIRTHYSLLTTAIKNIAAPSIRNLATLGGNVLSRVGDALPALLVYEAVLLWHDGQGEFQQTLAQWLLEAQVSAGWKNRLLLAIILPPVDLPEQEGYSRLDVYHKVGRREVFTPSIATVAISAIVSSVQHIVDVRLAAGGGQTAPKRLEHTELLLKDAKLDRSLLHSCYTSVMEHFHPIGDVFASESYRKKTAANLIVSELWKAMQPKA
ncbi:FAD binding domain-containing protein [Paenibacillus sp. FSL H8-0537]|uniref:FAD binding domain-containing protein n=1 Tax=Paenibacillus sp. FSL H8-0537 TaxID=2921399 RepID=UPI0031015EFC